MWVPGGGVQGDEDPTTEEQGTLCITYSYHSINCAATVCSLSKPLI